VKKSELKNIIKEVMVSEADDLTDMPKVSTIHRQMNEILKSSNVNPTFGKHIAAELALTLLYVCKKGEAVDHDDSVSIAMFAKKMRETLRK